MHGKGDFHQLYHLLQDPCVLFTYILPGIPNRLALDFVYIVACPMPIILETSLIMLA